MTKLRRNLVFFFDIFKKFKNFDNFKNVKKKTQNKKGLVRVENYRSVTVITYEDFEKPGFTSMFTYHDNVSKILPSGIVFFVLWKTENDIDLNFGEKIII